MSLAVAAGVIFAMQLRRRLGDLEDAAEALARGDFAQRVPASSRDEIGRLARSFTPWRIKCTAARWRPPARTS